MGRAAGLDVCVRLGLPRAQSHYELHRNEVLVHAAQFSSQFNVDVSLTVGNRDDGMATVWTSDELHATMKRIQELPVQETVTRDQARAVAVVMVAACAR